MHVPTKSFTVSLPTKQIKNVTYYVFIIYVPDVGEVVAGIGQGTVSSDRVGVHALPHVGLTVTYDTDWFTISHTAYVQVKLRRVD